MLKNRNRLFSVLYVVWCAAIAFWLYGGVLELPFFFDDFVERPYVESLSLGEIWRTAGDLAYFRPLLFTTWKLITYLPGNLSPGIEHALNLVFFIGNAVLVGWLAGQFWSATIPGGERGHPSRAPWMRIFLAASLFLFFPFSYQAVPWLGSLSHILSTFLILSTVACYWRWRKSGRWATRNGRLWAALSLLLALLTPFAHENGILIGPIILASHLTFNPKESSNPPKPFTFFVLRFTHYLPWFLPTLIWLPIWWVAPKAVSGTIELQSAETLLQNSVYFLQGIAYPFTWVGGWLRETAGLNDLLVAGGISLIGLFIAALVLWRGKADRRSLFPIVWIVLAAVPTILLLPFDYIINGPRLLLLAGVGAVWLWTDVIMRVLYGDRTAVQGLTRPSWIRYLLVGGLLFVVLLQNAAFIRERMNIHRALGDVYRDVVEITSQTNQRDQTAVFINLPSWITPGTLAYAVGHEGVQFWPDYAQPHTLASITTGNTADIVLVRNEAIRPEMSYFYGVGGQAADWSSLAEEGATVFVSDYQPQEITLRPVGILGASEQNGSPLASFNQGQIILEGAKVGPSDDGTVVRLTWRVVEPPPDSVTVFVHVIDGSGQLVIQADGDPLAGSFPLGQWPAGLTAEDIRTIPFSREGLQVLVGLYDRNSGERWTAETAEGESLPDNAVSIPVSPD